MADCAYEEFYIPKSLENLILYKIESVGYWASWIYNSTGLLQIRTKQSNKESLNNMLETYGVSKVK